MGNKNDDMFKVKLSELKEIFAMNQEINAFGEKFMLSEKKEEQDLYFQKLLEREKVLEARINLLPYYARKVVKPVVGICSRDLVRFVKVCELCGLEIDYVH